MTKEEPVDWPEEEEEEWDIPSGGNGGGEEGVRFIDTRRGRKALLYHGHIFYLSSTKKQSSYWKCSQRKTGCLATMILKHFDSKRCTFSSFAEGNKPHSHRPSKEKLQKREVQAKERQDKPPSSLDLNSPAFRNSRHLCLFCLSDLPPGYLEVASVESMVPSGQTLAITLNDPGKNTEAFEVLCQQLNVRWRKKDEGANFDPGRSLPLCYSCQSLYQELWQVHVQIKQLERLLIKQAKAVRKIMEDTQKGKRGAVIMEAEEVKKTQLWMLGLHLFWRKVVDPVFNLRGDGAKPETEQIPKMSTEEETNPLVQVKQEVVDDEVNEALNNLMEEGSWMAMDDIGADDTHSPEETEIPKTDDNLTKENKSTRRSLRNKKTTTKDSTYSPVPSEEEDEEAQISSSSSSDDDSDYSKTFSKKRKTSDKVPAALPIPRGPRGLRKRPAFPIKRRQSKFRSKRYNKINICHLCDARVIGGKAFLEHYTTVHPDERRYTCKFCSRHFTHPQSVLTHQRNRHTGEKPYKCPSCPATFASNPLLISHTRTRHADRSSESFSCPECSSDNPKTFPRQSMLNNHLVAAHDYPPTTAVYQKSGKPVKTLCCHLCDAQLLGHGPFLQHYQEAHPQEKRFTCKFCKRHFPYIREVLAHQRRHTGEKPVQCTQCGKSFIDERSLRSHESYHHTDNQQEFRCPICPNKVYNVRQKLTAHLYTHKELIVICKACGRTFRSNNSFYKHNRQVHGAKAQCTEPISSQEGMNPEMLKKLGVQEQVQCRRKCHVCWAPIPGKWFLQKHFDDCHPDHPGDWKTCRCGKQFENYKRVYNHAVRHHTADENKPFQCEQCPSRFLTLRELANHSHTHIPVEERQKEHLCPQCGLGLSSAYAVKKHMKKHEGPQPRFVCEECGKDYAEKKGLLAHKKLEHLKIKPHKCPFEGCGKSFPLRSILKKHQNIHTGENKYPCEHCGKNFHYLGSLKRHLREVHNTQGEKGQTPRKRKGRRTIQSPGDDDPEYETDGKLESHHSGPSLQLIGGYPPHHPPNASFYSRYPVIVGGMMMAATVPELPTSTNTTLVEVKTDKDSIE